MQGQREPLHGRPIDRTAGQGREQQPSRALPQLAVVAVQRRHGRIEQVDAHRLVERHQRDIGGHCPATVAQAAQRASRSMPATIAELGYCVRKGEHAIWIFAPMSTRRRNSDPGAETDEQQRRVLFRAVPVFDRAQVEPLDGASPRRLSRPASR